MNGQDVFEILEIEPTNDKRAIKKAYAGLVKKYHPEEQPDKWREIYDAYTVALKMAECGQRDEPASPMYDIEKSIIPIGKGENAEEQQHRSAEMEEMDALFDSIEHLSAEQRRQNEQMQREAMQKAVEMFQKMIASKESNGKEWEDFFHQDDILPLISHKEFLLQFGDCLSNQTINAKLCQLLKEQLQVIAKYHADRNLVMADGEFSDVVRYVERRIDAAHWANIAAQAKDSTRQNKRNRFLNAIMGIAIFAILGMALTILAILLVVY